MHTASNKLQTPTGSPSAPSAPGSGEHGPTVQVGRHDLVGNDDGHPKLIRQPLEAPEEPAQVHLPHRQLPPAVELRPALAWGTTQRSQIGHPR